MTPSPQPQPASGEYGTESPCLHDTDGQVVNPRTEAVTRVGKDRLSLTDAEREQHIKDCAWLMEDAMRRYYETSCLTYRGEASRWRILMEEAIKSRPAEYVAKLEAERGLA